MWAGSALIFCSSDASIVYGETGRVATTLEKFYYTGFTLSTLGVGDYIANSDTWRLFTVVLSLSGFMLITTAVSYMLPVLSADVEKNKISTYIRLLGTSPQDILINHWRNNGFQGLEQHFLKLTDYVIHYNKQLLAYPILYNFHHSDLHQSVVLNIGKVDEALTILKLYIPKDKRPQESAFNSLRMSITIFLLTQNSFFLSRNADKAKEVVYPDLEGLRVAGIPVLQNKEFGSNQNNKLLRRRGYFSYILRNEGRHFNDIYATSSALGENLDF